MMLYPKRLSFYYAFSIVYFIFQVTFLFLLRSVNEDSHTNAFKILELYKKFAIQLNQNTRVDNSGLFKIIHLKHLREKKSLDITVISQCSSNHFPTVENLFNAWEGPISVAIFSEVENIEKTLWNMARLMHCNNWRDFGLHLVVPVQDTYVENYNFPYALLTAAEKSISCNSNYIPLDNERRNYNWSSLYPVNLLRNVAKTGVSTDYVLIIDIDMLPSTNLRTDFINFIKLQRSTPGKVVYVIPTFEIYSEAQVPSNKAELLKAVESNAARPFYIVPCENCQKLTRYDEWLESNSLQGTKVLYQVEWKHPWEPFFIAKSDVPNFDERFKQYGMNRVSQICELHVAGFRFLVLDNLFLVHKGYKKLNDFHEKKEKEMEANRRLYVRFKTEVKYKYPESEKRC